MSVIAVLLFVAVTSYGNNLGKAPIQFNKDKICNKSKTRNVIQLSCILAVKFLLLCWRIILLQWL